MTSLDTIQMKERGMAEGACAIAPEWRRVPIALCGAYEVSSDGRVRRDGRELVCGVDRYGYRRVKLYYAAIPKTFRVHRLVCRTFHGPAPSPKHEACHADGDKLNNAKDNLRWGTKSENALDSLRHGTLKRPRGGGHPGERHPAAKLTSPQVEEIRRRCEAGEEQKSIAESFGVHPAAVSRIKRGKQWKSA